jgi:hypothetical protein
VRGLRALGVVLAHAAVTLATLVLATVLREPQAAAGTVAATNLIHYDSTDSTIADVQAIAFDRVDIHHGRHAATGNAYVDSTSADRVSKRPERIAARSVSMV